MLKSDQLSDQQSATSAAAQFLDLLNSSNAALAQSGGASTSGFCFGIPGVCGINGEELIAGSSSSFLAGGEDYSMYDGEDALVMDDDNDEMVNVTGNIDTDLEAEEEAKLNGIILAATYNSESLMLLGATNTESENLEQNPLSILSSAAEAVSPDVESATTGVDTEQNIKTEPVIAAEHSPKVLNPDDDKNKESSSSIKNEQLGVLSNLYLTDCTGKLESLKDNDNTEINANNNTSIESKLATTDATFDNVKESVKKTSLIES